MAELILKFRDTDGGDRSVTVAGTRFSVGRTPDNDLAIPDSRLSRRHLTIERFGDVFVASDAGSSNGSSVNGSPLGQPVALKNGDRLELGGGVVIDVEIIAAEPERQRGRRQVSAGPEAVPESSIPTAVLFVAPAIVLVLLICGGGALLVVNGGLGGSDPVVRDRQPTIEPQTPEDDTDTESPTPKASPSGSSTAPPEGSPSPGKTVAISDETRLIEQHSALFLRRIALNDDSAFLSSEHVAIVKSRIAGFRGSSALAENLKAVKRDAAQFESMAKEQGLKPQFLAAAALARIGNQTGSPTQTAKSMLPILGELRIALGNTLADDNLLIIADFPRRERNEKGSLQSKLEGLGKSAADAGKIRTIWFLKEKGKISNDQYELALRFIAVGTIMQNPKDFNVNAEPVVFQ